MIPLTRVLYRTEERMLSSLLRNGFSTESLILLLLSIPCIIIALTVHEYSHGYAAYKLGDDTARNYGRLTLNPAKHFDLFGTLFMLAFGFGWAKPVPINTRNFKSFKKGIVITAAAGPASNLIMGVIATVLNALTAFLMINVMNAVPETLFLFLSVLNDFLFIFAFMNFSLALFNLIPIPPLDGSRILFAFLPDELHQKLMRYERIIMIVFLIILWSDIIPLPTGGIAQWLYSLIFRGILKILL